MFCQHEIGLIRGFLAIESEEEAPSNGPQTSLGFIYGGIPNQECIELNLKVFVTRGLPKRRSKKCWKNSSSGFTIALPIMGSILNTC
ncbi:hypothetical protein Trydic_g15873 [Trypoxylus dichotomus]